MNILPKKSWHVRTKKNIARVRKDEAKAAEEEKETQRRIALAAQEARTALLRERAGRRLEEDVEAGGRDHGEIGGEEEGISTEQVKGDKGGNEDDLRFGIALGSLKDVVQPDGHVNFFQDVEAGKRGPSGVNEEHEEEKKREQEEYEKKIGYLVYLGQDSVEQSKDKPWWSKKVTGGGGGGSKEGIQREVERQRELDRAAGVVGGLEEKMVKVAGRKKGEGEGKEEEDVTVEQVKMTKFKSYLDPLKDIRKYLSMPGMKEAGGKGEKMGSSSKRKLDTPPPSSSPRKRRKGEETEEEKGKRKKKSKKSKKKHKHHRNHSSERRRRKRSRGDSSGEGDEEDEEEKRRKLKRMREERLEREREERRRAQKVLAKLRGEEEGEVGGSGGKGGGDKGGGDPSGIQGGSSTSSSSTMASVKQKYNSQFNPHLARQNYE